MNFFAYRFGLRHVVLDETLAEHDKAHHPHGFNPDTDSCKVREEQGQIDLGDLLDRREGEAAAAYMETVQKGVAGTPKPQRQTAKELYGKQYSRIEEARKKFGDILLPDSAEIQKLGDYFGHWKDLAHGIKEGDAAAIDEAADVFSRRIPNDAVIVPMPSHGGTATTTLSLADAIAKKVNGISVADVLRAEPHESSYEQKKRGELPKPIAMRLDGVLPTGRPIYVLDNVIGSGVTAASALKSLPKGTVVLAVSDTLQGTAKKLFGPPPQPPQVQQPPRPRVEPEWSRMAREEHPAKVMMDGEGKPVVAFPRPSVPRRNGLGRNAKARESVLWLIGQKPVSMNEDGTSVKFDVMGTGEYVGSNYSMWLGLVEAHGLTEEQIEEIKMAAKSRPDLRSQKSVSIIPQARGESNRDFLEISKGAKEWAKRTSRAKSAAIPYLREIIANATDGKHLTQAQMTAATTESHSSRKQGPAWGGGCHFYDVRFSVPDEDGTPRTYKGRLMLREDADGNRYLYDVLDLDDGSGFTQFFKAKQKAKHAQQDAERGVVRDAN